MANITIYGKLSSPNTKAALEAYGEKAKYIDVGSGEKLDEMLEHSGGVRQIPVIVKHDEDDKVEVGHEGSS